jgi:GNAT superfamily N-acetyltransferase
MGGDNMAMSKMAPARTNDLPEMLFLNPVWHSLHSEHSSLAVCEGEACRYPADVAPFAAVREPSQKALFDVRDLLHEGEALWISGEGFPTVKGIVFETTLPCLQMILPADVEVPSITTEIEPLGEANASEMVSLTTLAFPGFFRQRTYVMGTYYGVRSTSGELVAMAGERLRLPGFPEISGVCTHPKFRGRGLASVLMWQLIRKHRRNGLQSWLHVGSENQRAIDLYRHMGFRKVREINMHRIRKK